MSVQYADAFISRDFAGVGGNPLAGDRSFDISHASSVPAETQRAMMPFTSGSSMERAPYQGFPTTHQTIPWATRYNLELIANMMQLHEEQAGGWWSQFASMTKLRERTDERITIFITDPAIMERGAQLTVPNLIQFRTEEYVVGLSRYHHGFDIYTETLDTEQGQRELAIKAHAATQNSLLTQKLIIANAAIRADDITLKNYFKTTNWRDIEHYTRHSRKMFGCIQKNHAALPMIMSFLETAFSSNPRRPTINMAVMNKKGFHQLRFSHPRNMEVYRAGQDMVDRVLKSGTSQEFAAGLFPYALYADEKCKPVNSESDLAIDTFQRLATLGAYGIIEHDDDGPTLGGGFGNRNTYQLPTVQFVTLPKNDFENFTILDGLMNDARFSDDDEHGSIYPKTKKLIDAESNYRDFNNGNKRGTYGRGHHVKDMFIYQPIMMTGVSGNKADSGPRVCEYVGEIDLEYLPQNYIEKQARRAADNSSLTDAEMVALSNLIAAADNLYKSDYLNRLPDDEKEQKLFIMLMQCSFQDFSDEQGEFEEAQRAFQGSDPASDEYAGLKADLEEAGTKLAAKVMSEDIKGESEYGGALVNPALVIAKGELFEEVDEPVGLGGDNFGLMSLLKQARDIRATFPKWVDGHILDYKLCASALNKITGYQGRAFFKCGLNDETALPMFRQTGNVKRDRVIASLRGPFERAKHGIWFERPLEELSTTGTSEEQISRRKGETSFTMSDDDNKVELKLAFQNAQALASTFVKLARDRSQANQKIYGKIKSGVFAAESRSIDEFVEKIVEVGSAITRDEIAAMPVDNDRKRALKKAARLDAAAALAATISHFLSLAEEERLDELESIEKADVETIYGVSFLAVKAIKARQGEDFNAPSLTPDDQPNIIDRENVAPYDYKVTRMTLDVSHFNDQGRIPGSAGYFYGTNAREGTDAPVPYVRVDPSVKSRFARAPMTSRMSTADDPAYRSRMAERGVEITGQFRDKSQQMDARRTQNVGGLFKVINDYIYDEGKDVGKKGQWLAERQHIATRVSIIQSTFPEDRGAENAICRYFAYSMMFLHICRRSFLELVFNNLHIPMNYIFASYSIRMHTQALMLAEGGGQTCRFNFAHVMTSVPEDAGHRIRYYNMSTYMGAEVIDPSKVIMLNDVSMDGYLGGLSKTFVRTGQDMQGKNKKDIVAMGVPVTFTRDMSFTDQHNPLPLAGFHDSDYYNGSFPEKERIFRREPHFVTWPFYNHFLNFNHTVNLSNTKPLFTSFREVRKNRWNPLTLWHRRTRTYNSAKGVGVFDYSRGTLGSGHLDDLDPQLLNFRAALDGEIEYRVNHLEHRGGMGI